MKIFTAICLIFIGSLCSAQQSEQRIQPLEISGETKVIAPAVEGSNDLYTRKQKAVKPSVITKAQPKSEIAICISKEKNIKH